jgi:Skp family chaperone for outer membrane proteins
MYSTRRLGILLFSLAVMGLRPPLSPAQSPGGAPEPVPAPAAQVGVVDVVRVFDECDQIRDLNQILKEANEAYQKEAEVRKKVLAQRETELAAFAPDSPDYPPRRREFTRMSIEYNVWLQQSRAELARDHFNWTRVVYEECCKVVSEVARERGMTLVLQKRDFKPDLFSEDDVDRIRQVIHGRNVVWFDASLDITDAVIKKMNQRYKERGGRAKLKPGERP